MPSFPGVRRQERHSSVEIASMQLLGASGGRPWASVYTTAFIESNTRVSVARLMIPPLRAANGCRWIRQRTQLTGRTDAGDNPCADRPIVANHEATSCRTDHERDRERPVLPPRGHRFRQWPATDLFVNSEGLVPSARGSCNGLVGQPCGQGIGAHKASALTIGRSRWEIGTVRGRVRRTIAVASPR
jgi:hypothetical protein